MSIAKSEGGIGSVKYRGEGPRTKYKCPECQQTSFSSVIVAFVYWDFDLMLDEPELAGQEFFHVFLFYAVCERCRQTSQVTDLGKL